MSLSELITKALQDGYECEPYVHYVSPSQYEYIKEHCRILELNKTAHRKSLKKLKRHFRSHWRYTRKQEENL
jgi:hypothetical protein